MRHLEFAYFFVTLGVESLDTLTLQVQPYKETMFVLENYWIAVLFCVITMLCWGSWANTQKLAGKTWRFELFYWDYVFGVVLTALLFAFTLGSTGETGRSFLADLAQADPMALGSAFLGGVVFNVANILIVAAIAIAGMSVAFPIGIGLALVLGVLINYVAKPEGEPIILFAGVALVTVAIIINAVAYRQLPNQKQGGGSTKGILIAVCGGILMSLFYFLVARSLAETLDDGTLEAGKLTAYTANLVFTLGVLVSSFLFVTAIMRKPFAGEPVAPSAYFKGGVLDHLWGIIGGSIWAVGMTLNVIASGVASPAVSYGLGQGATLVAAIWGVFVWREFKDGNATVKKLLNIMFITFFLGLALIIWAKV
ncbi:MAG: GRP family sugar transporter [Planctomycetaceae bacterium]|nr:GRP family sugar transporter [Planctomycetaceae bacterium]